MNIGIDIDDTISKTCEEVDVWAKEYTEKILKRKFKIKNIKILDPMWAKYLYGWTVEEDKQFWDLYYENIMGNVKPKKDASQVINKLYENNNIVIITARWDRKNGIINEITKNWLEKYNIHYNKLFLSPKDKRELVKENNIDLFIDDSYKTCKQVAGIGVKTLMMDSRINKEMQDENIERVFSWKDIEEKVKEASK